MMRIWKVVAVPVFALGSAFPALAEIDAPNLTCGDFIAMASEGRTEAAQAVINWANAPGTSLEGCQVSAQVQGRTVAQVQAWMEARCNGRAVDDKVVAELCELQ